MFLSMLFPKIVFAFSRSILTFLPTISILLGRVFLDFRITPNILFYFPRCSHFLIQSIANFFSILSTSYIRPDLRAKGRYETWITPSATYSLKFFFDVTKCTDDSFSVFHFFFSWYEIKLKISSSLRLSLSSWETRRRSQSHISLVHFDVWWTL